VPEETGLPEDATLEDAIVACRRPEVNHPGFAWGW